SRGECLELKNGRSSYGPLFGPTRSSPKYLPGDFLYYNFDIDKLTPKEKTGIVVYQQTMEIVNKDNKTALKQGPTTQEMPLMIGSAVHSYVQIFLPTDTPPGPYKLKLSVSDRVASPPATRELTYDFELLKPAFGIVAASAPGVVFAGQDLQLAFGLVGMKRD